MFFSCVLCPGAVLQPNMSHAFLTGEGAEFSWSPPQPGWEPVCYSVPSHWDPLKPLAWSS